MGRPRKNPAATKAPKAKAAQTPPEAASKPVEPKTDNHTAELTEAITTALRPLIDELKAHMLIAARLAAADTLHSMQQPEIVMNHALKEGRQAAEILSYLPDIKEG